MSDPDLVKVLRAQADQIAAAQFPGWGNTMRWAADEIDRLHAEAGRQKEQLAADRERAERLEEALRDAEKDLVVCQRNARHAEKRDERWKGVAGAIQPTIDKARTALSDSAQGGERNQCDGCARGIQVNEDGMHVGPAGFRGGDVMACTADRYSTPAPIEHPPHYECEQRECEFTETMEQDRQDGPDERAEAINVVFDGPPGPTAGRFVEVETDDGRSIRAGEWIKRDDGLWALRIHRHIERSEAEKRVPPEIEALADRWDQWGFGSPEACAAELRRAIAQAKGGRDE